MFDFQIPNISCAHCVRAITEAIRRLDPNANVQVDIPRRTVHVETSAGREAVVEALDDEGYSPCPVP
jgi:copper chaperone